MDGGGAVSDFKFEFTNLAEFQGPFRRGQQIVVDELVKSGETLAKEGERLSDRYLTADWRGETRRSIWSSAARSSDGVRWAFGASAKQAIVVDKGRTAGSAMPLKGSMLAWMSSKGIPAKLEFVVRRAIGRRGIRPRPFVTKAFNELKAGRIQREFNSALSRAVKRIAGGG
jgi:hypothetical protein